MVLESYQNTLKILKILKKKFSDDIIDNILQYILFDIRLEHLSRNKLYLILENDLFKKRLFNDANTYSKKLFKKYLHKLNRYQILHFFNKYNVQIYTYCINSNQDKILKNTIGNYYVFGNTIRFKDTIIKEDDNMNDIKIMRIFNDNNIIITNITKSGKVLIVHLDYLLYNIYIKNRYFDYFNL